MASWEPYEGALRARDGDDAWAVVDGSTIAIVAPSRSSVLVHTGACDLASVLDRKNALPHPRGPGKLEINPFLVTRAGAVALDARVIPRDA
jgi:hypothetical protein